MCDGSVTCVMGQSHVFP